MRTPSAPLHVRLDALRIRLTRWEYWPAWIIYLPLTPFLLWFSFRYGGIAVCTVCNPAIPLGGLVGESKSQILSMLPQAVVVPFRLLRPGSIESRLHHCLQTMSTRGWSWPLILKPDAGCRGTGVSLIQSVDQVREYLGQYRGPVIMQQYHPGPHEAGVFYTRSPDQQHGRILSITLKQFPTVTGDGRSTLRELIWNHPRHRAQASVHLDYLEDRALSVPADGEVVRIGFAGNHCRGTMFIDGSSLITPQLEQAFDTICLQTPGFHFGRFDVRFESLEQFKQGRGFSIIELNGLTSESTNIYDPSTRFRDAQATLRQQWKTAYAIGKANQLQGHPRPTLRSVFQTLRSLAIADTTP